MAKPGQITGNGKIAAAFAAAAAVALALPSAGLALVGEGSPSLLPIQSEFAPFTPATVDPQLARRVAENIRAKGLDIGFTPAGASAAGDKTVTVAVRFDDQTARAISVRNAANIAQAKPGARNIAITPTRYNLGVARGYQTFGKAPALATSVPSGVRSVEMPDLSEYRPSSGTAERKPSRFEPRIALENDGREGRSRTTREGLGEQSVDLGGAYRVTRNLDVTAGVRLSQDRDRIAPLTDNVQDDQAVYVGTQFRF
ncbi:hypothetical protein [Pontixanthobacter aquaemixtae]|uniref:Uncharacterized protein n=1 Tax=Pontixanthobacter aquaemixtae TaxID=1958940 RepID=A0A844ZV00_9SPHN|nr:hypothetical protein [Pontixanthobacter aquaemixtae]MXO91568.1 hypothetical protein [Pontixanthobacter aquaemixtae]